MQQIFHPADKRGKGEYGWLSARYNFSFANYFDPERVRFGALRVLNNDVIAAGQGFGTHDHENMEIITIPLSGALAHKDSLGHSSTIRTGEVQVMSAGTGVLHSEFNASQTESIELLQIWIFPDQNAVAPRYDQRAFPLFSEEQDTFALVAGPSGSGTLEIHQEAFLSLGTFGPGTAQYVLNRPGHGAYCFLIAGEAEVAGQILGPKDALGVWETKEMDLSFRQPSTLLIIEVPMA